MCMYVYVFCCQVVIMGSSSASITDGNINTSTDSASTLVTSVTHTDTSETCDSLDLGMLYFACLQHSVHR